MPVAFRSTLATNSQPNLVVAFPSLHVPAVECTGSDHIKEMRRRIETLEQFSDEYENLTQIFADSHPMAMDPEGRVVLPDHFKEYAGIGAEIAFVGRGTMFHLWDPARYEEHRAMVRERSRQQKTTLPGGGAARQQAGGDA